MKRLVPVRLSSRYYSASFFILTVATETGTSFLFAKHGFGRFSVPHLLSEYLTTYVANRYGFIAFDLGSKSQLALCQLPF